MRTRFAPSPNGALHLGHAYAAAQAHDLARQLGGAFLLRIEDIDGVRSRPELVEAILADLRWLGLEWDGDVLFQSSRLAAYDAALAGLKARDLVYPCFCTRSQIAAAGAQPGPEGLVYPGTCRALSIGERADRMAREPHAWRLDVRRALAQTGALVWHDMGAGEQAARPALFGDVVLARKDAPASYHLAVTLDDAHQQVSHVVRGRDLFLATHVHRLLQALLGLPVPLYRHHRLLAGSDGRKLAKSEGAAALALLREQGVDGPSLLENLRKGLLPSGISWAEPSYSLP
ncbi:tRNA glutamyl-Q(34) synthetase GluQRS [Blastomonas sp. UPD001]|jgi:glutamyl-Q tRNA(Asp) synthetase|uniref:tRNA glutamyl-Q(34) synthetase GluQRS n=1 Tax=Blastomonas sp. UPD001 TaxID=2217673 RepID=UPI000E351312|nr:tRNA glutamyl-Q(34) synthetase GluQRS [Blastomonas sp. UPD001]MBL0967327.1 tRNA glutamyl-Q(34) synthetase GluQRS [Blastomonas sp.]